MPSSANSAPLCGQSKPTIVSKRVHATKNQRYRCDGCATEFTIHIGDTIDNLIGYLKPIKEPRQNRRKSDKVTSSSMPMAVYRGVMQTRPRHAIPLCSCRHYPEFEIRDGKWKLYCAQCGRIS